MGYFFMDLFRNPLRALVGIVVGLTLVLVLFLYGVPHAGADALQWLGGVLAALTLLAAVRIPMKFIVTCMLIAIIIVGAMGVLRGVATASGPLFSVVLLFVLLLPVLSARRWWRAHIHRPTPPSHGAHWATWRDLKKGGFFP